MTRKPEDGSSRRDFLRLAATGAPLAAVAVAVSGQMRTRIAREVETEVQANVLALESRDGDTVLDQAVFVSCGLVNICEEVRTRSRELVLSLIHI